MRSRMFVKRAMAFCTAIAAVGFAAGTRAQSAERIGFEPFQASGMTRIVIPSAFELPSSDAGLHLATVVTTDFDSDGDLDVVASDGATHLFVWINDGAGHLTRRARRVRQSDMPHEQQRRQRRRR